MRRELFHYDLPPERIATHPPAERDGARLLVLDPGCEPRHAMVRDLDALLAPGALVVVNDTRVIPARLLGQKVGSGGKVELLLVRRLGEASLEEGGATVPAQRWTALGRASKPLRPGARLVFEREEGVTLFAQIEARAGDDAALEVLLFAPPGHDLDRTLDAAGHVPLPPYMRRADELSDRARYQTVFAKVPGAVAAPTAGLHLSEGLLERLRARGALLTSVTLHVGLGTFQPVTADDFDDHPMHAEVLDVSPEAAAAIAGARARGAPVVAIGTTVVRALESAADPERPGFVLPRTGETRLLIQPGYEPKVVDQLLTNFHLPESTLLALVSAFAGRERVLAAYQTAIEAGYRFYSYGDAMLVRARGPRP